MRTVLNDKEIVISFSYPKGKRGATTLCKLLMGGVGVRDEQKETIGLGKTRRDSRDTPNNTRGRREAFKKALMATTVLTNEEKFTLWSSLPLRSSKDVSLV